MLLGDGWEQWERKDYIRLILFLLALSPLIGVAFLIYNGTT